MNGPALVMNTATLLIQSLLFVILVVCYFSALKSASSLFTSRAAIVVSICSALLSVLWFPRPLLFLIVDWYQFVLIALLLLLLLFFLSKFLQRNQSNSYADKPAKERPREQEAFDHKYLMRKEEE